MNKVKSSWWSETDKEKMLARMDVINLKKDREYYRKLYERTTDEDIKEQLASTIAQYDAELEKRRSGEQGIDYEAITYPRGTNKEYTMVLNERYEYAVVLLGQKGINAEAIQDDIDARRVLDAFVFSEYKGTNWGAEYQPIVDAVNDVLEKRKNDFKIQN